MKYIPVRSCSSGSMKTRWGQSPRVSHCPVRPTCPAGLISRCSPYSGKRHSCRFTMTRQFRSGRSAASPNRDFQLHASRGDNARDARPPHAVPAHFNRRPTSEVRSSFLSACFHRHSKKHFFFEYAIGTNSTATPRSFNLCRLFSKADCP